HRPHHQSGPTRDSGSRRRSSASRRRRAARRGPYRALHARRGAPRRNDRNRPQTERSTPVKLTSLVALLSLAAVPAATAAAQVGHLPSESPYRDVPFKQEVTLFGGTYQGAIG